MKTIGLIGGMSWESTAIYYRLLNDITKERRGGLHSASLLIQSFDFAPIAQRQADGHWLELRDQLSASARRLQDAGAQALLICSNTMHKLYAEVQAAVDVPVLHIADATAQALKHSNRRRPLLLATRYTMEQPFYRERLARQHGIDALVPDDTGRTVVHDIIYDELCRGIVNPRSKATLLAEIAKAEQAGADSVILGCTEVCMLIGQPDTALPVFDTTALHARSAVEFALAER